MGGKLLGHKNCPLSTTNRAKGTQVTVKYLVHALPNFDDYRTYFNFVFLHKLAFEQNIYSLQFSIHVHIFIHIHVVIKVVIVVIDVDIEIYSKKSIKQ